MIFIHILFFTICSGFVSDSTLRYRVRLKRQAPRSVPAADSPYRACYPCIHRVVAALLGHVLRLLIFTRIAPHWLRWRPRMILPVGLLRPGAPPAFTRVHVSRVQHLHTLLTWTPAGGAARCQRSKVSHQMLAAIRHVRVAAAGGIGSFHGSVAQGWVIRGGL